MISCSSSLSVHISVNFLIYSLENKPKKELVQLLVRRGYDSDPVKAWKQAQDKLKVRGLLAP